MGIPLSSSNLCPFNYVLNSWTSNSWNCTSAFPYVAIH
jgi:hypothetical protein